jgi:membrane-associated phospholipid phosphatase
MALPFQKEQLDFLVHLVSHRTDWLDPFFLFLNYLDTPYFVAFLIPCIWLGFSPREGLKVGYLLLINGLLNKGLKAAFGWPRPTVATPEIGLLIFDSPGFPSGGAQMSMLLGALFIYKYKKSWSYALGCLYIGMVSFSRLYLGVHYPLDILGGWILGGSLFYLFIKIEPWIDRTFSQTLFTPFSIVLLSLFFIVLIVVFPLSAAILSLTICFLIQKNQQKAAISSTKKIIKGTLAGVSTLLFFAFLSTAFPLYLTAFLFGGWIYFITFVSQAIDQKGL